MVDKRLDYSKEYLESKKNQRNFFIITIVLLTLILLYLLN